MSFKLLFIVAIQIYCCVGRVDGSVLPPLLCFNWSSPSPENVSGLYDLVDSSCLGGDSALLSTGVWLTYNVTYANSEASAVESNSFEIWVEYNSSPTLQYQRNNESQRNITGVDYFFNQPEHGGGRCHCLFVYFSDNCERETSDAYGELCNGSASYHRRIEVVWTPSDVNFRRVETDEENLKDLPFQLNCNDTQTRLHINFSVFTSEELPCDPLEDFGRGKAFGEGIELAIRFSSLDEWVPIIYAHMTGDHPESIRGYKLKQRMELKNDSYNLLSVSICGFDLNETIRLRWLQSSFVALTVNYSRDVWSLDDISIYVENDTEQCSVLVDSFENITQSNMNWKPYNIRNGRVDNYCSHGSQAMVFGQNSINLNRNQSYSNNSRSLLTQTIALSDLLNLKGVASLTDRSIFVSESPEAPATSDYDSLTYDQKAIMYVESEALRQILADKQLREIFNTTSIQERLLLLQAATSGGFKPVLAMTYLLYDTVTAFKSEDNVMNYSIVEIILQLGDALISLIAADTSKLSDTSAAIVGTSLLLAIDQVALLSTDQTYITTNVLLQVKTSSAATNSGDYITTIDTSLITSFPPPNSSLKVPQNELQQFANNGALTTQATTIRNVSPLFPEGIQRENERYRLVSDVVGTSIRCGTSNCPTNNLNLKLPVQITFQHSNELIETLNSSWTTACVFLDIPKHGSTLNLGRWSSRGCEKNLKMSSNKMTVCECDHLTHFAILLSPSPPEYSHSVKLSLSIIGYVGVAVSVFTMGLTILTFVFLKSLRTLRNFITANLCINLSVAQILFVTGVNRTGNEAENIPLHCQVIAVLLHYFFLVSFMWMLMEGVFLYLTLVKVFIRHSKHYLVAFLLICYGGPAIYMGALTLPLGFAMNGSPHYGYAKACFLRPDTYFVWAFIAPVILILLANIGFFIMAGVIMWRHQKKQRDKSRFQHVCNWLRSALSLVVIMGLTWILGLLVVEVDELAPLAYIFTIMVAFQGFFIFLMYVIFSKVVHQAYGKWWKSTVNSSETLSKYFGESQRFNKERSKSMSKSTASTNGSSIRKKPNLADFSSPTRDSINFFPTSKNEESQVVKVDYSLMIRDSVGEGGIELETFKKCSEQKEPGTFDMSRNEDIQTSDSVFNGDGRASEDNCNGNDNEELKTGTPGNSCTSDCETKFLM